MFLTVHATAAIIIAQKVPNPWLAFSLGFLSHYLMDAIPHGDEKMVDHLDHQAKIKTMAKMALVDFIIAISWLNFLFNQNKASYTFSTLAAVVGSMLPDFLNGTYLIFKFKWLAWNSQINDWSHFLFFKKPLPARQGFAIQGLFFLLLTAIIFWLG